MSRENNSTVVPIGLIVSAWGGTEIEMWQPNKTIDANCKVGTRTTRLNHRITQTPTKKQLFKAHILPITEDFLLFILLLISARRV